MTNINTQINRVITIKQGVFYISLLTLCIVGYFYTLYDEVGMLNRVYEDSVLLKVRIVVIPLVLMMPALGVLIWGVACQILPSFTAHNTKRGMFFIIFSFPIFVISLLIYNWQMMNWLDDQGYSECSFYSGASLGAAKIMVNNPYFCIEEGYQVRIALLDWFEEQYLQGITPTADMITSKQEQLLLAYNERFNLL